MQSLPRVSGGIEAFEFYIETMLNWQCADCGAFVDAASDVRKEEEQAMPSGPWMIRKAREGIESGWYVHPLTEDGSLVPVCLCPSCAARRSLEVQKEKTA